MTQGEGSVDEVYCSSCGSLVKIQAEYCMKCGVKPTHSLSQLRPPLAPSALRRESTPQTPDTGNTPALPALLMIAAAGGILGIPAILQVELPGGLLVPWIWAPIAEEVFKPTGVYLILLKWPEALKSPLYTAAFSALAGVSFGVLESTLYTTVYVAHPTSSYVLFRFTIPVALHALASFTFGLGINKRLVESLRKGGPFYFSNWSFFLLAILIHSVYNITVSILNLFEKI